jgi:hypothetical protein
VIDLQGKGLLISSASMDSAYLVQCVPLEVSYLGPDYPALLVAIEYLSAVEGELWKRVRGLGLAYGCVDRSIIIISGLSSSSSSSLSFHHRRGSIPSVDDADSFSMSPVGAPRYEITCSPEQGLLTLALYKAAHLANAFEEALNVVRGETNDSPFRLSYCLPLRRGAIDGSSRLRARWLGLVAQIGMHFLGVGVPRHLRTMLLVPVSDELLQLFSSIMALLEKKTHDAHVHDDIDAPLAIPPPPPSPLRQGTARVRCRWTRRRWRPRGRP